MAMSAARKHPGASYVVCDIRSLPFKEACFEIILSPSTIDHFSRHDFRKSIGEMMRVSSNCNIFLFLHNKINYWLHFQTIKFLKLSRYPLYTYSRRTLQESIGRTYSINRVSTICHLPFTLFSRNMFARLGRISYIKNILTHTYRSLEKLEATPFSHISGELLVAEISKK